MPASTSISMKGLLLRSDERHLHSLFTQPLRPLDKSRPELYLKVECAE